MEVGCLKCIGWDGDGVTFIVKDGCDSWDIELWEQWLGSGDASEKRLPVSPQFIVQRWRALRKPDSQTHQLSGERRYWKHRHCKWEPVFLAGSLVSTPWWLPTHIAFGELQEAYRSPI